MVIIERVGAMSKTVGGLGESDHTTDGDGLGSSDAMLSREADEIITSLRSVVAAGIASEERLEYVANLGGSLEQFSNGSGANFSVHNRKRARVFLNYNVLLAKDIATKGCPSTKGLEESIIEAFHGSNSTRMAMISGSGSLFQLSVACEHFLIAASSEKLSRTLPVIWLLCTLLMKQGQWQPVVEILASTCSIAGSERAGDENGDTRRKEHAVHLYLLAVARLGLNGDGLGARLDATESVRKDPSLKPASALVAELIAEHGDEEDATVWASQCKGIASALSALGCVMARAPDHHRAAINLFRQAIEADVWAQKESMYNVAVLYGAEKKYAAMRQMLLLLRQTISEGGDPESAPDFPNSKGQASTIMVGSATDSGGMPTPARPDGNASASGGTDETLLAMATYMLARAEVELGHYGEACTLYEGLEGTVRSAKMVPLVEFDRQRALALLWDGSPEAASKIIGPRWQEDQANPSLAEVYADALLGLHESSKALEVLQGIRGSDSMPPSQRLRVLNNMSLVFTCEGKYLDALEVVTEAAALSEGAAEPVFNKCFLLLRMGRGNEASESWLDWRDIPRGRPLQFYTEKAEEIAKRLSETPDRSEKPCSGKVQGQQLLSMDLMALEELIHLRRQKQGGSKRPRGAAEQKAKSSKRRK